MEFIRGESREQTLLLPERVEDYVDDNNAVRVIDAYVNSLDMAGLGFAKPEPGNTGRPAYNPQDLLKLYVYGYMNKARSSRRLETESKRNLEALRLLGKLPPDHKTIADFRRDNPAALKNVFRNFVRLCVRTGLYGKELTAIDGSRFKAVNSRKRNYTEQQIQDKTAKMTAKTGEYLEELDRNDAAEAGACGEKSKEEIGKIIGSLRRHKQRYEGYAAELEQTGEKQKSLTDAEKPPDACGRENGRVL